MIQELQLGKTSTVLEVGTGSGYQTALLASTCQQVYSLEMLPELSARAPRMCSVKVSPST